jgi:pimeloyl-ACP methyl ester carboxylesterase
MDTVATKQTNQIQGQEGNIYIEDGGSGGLPVVFTHSFGGNSSHWKNQLKHLRSKRRAIAFDFRGHGRSSASSTAQYTAEALAGDIAAVVDGLDLDKFVLVGHSMGGSAAIAYADSHPNRVAGLVLAGTPGKTPVEISKPVIASLRSDDYQKVMDDYMKKLVTDSKPAVRAKLNNGVKKISREASINIIQAMFEFDPIDMVKRFKGPVLIIVTPNDQKQPNMLYNQMPGVQSKVIDGTSHWTQLDKPEEFNRTLDDFLKNIK